MYVEMLNPFTVVGHFTAQKKQNQIPYFVLTSNIKTPYKFIWAIWKQESDGERVNTDYYKTENDHSRVNRKFKPDFEPFSAYWQGYDINYSNLDCSPALIDKNGRFL